MQLLLEQDTNELERYIVLYQALGLPTTLAEMQMDSLNDQELLAIGIQATLLMKRSIECPLRSQQKR